ncbi:hypothetical protein [Thalassovita gelatinovora]|nr:hypothetical protein [Thalassovita gelatinovora]QIZ82578.1 hypothetical protein HFZ77_12830 [Thalassovita gelatinovora]
MKNIVVTSLIALTIALGSPVLAQTECYADYKAKQDAPLRLHYGVAQITGTCSKSSATSELKSRLTAEGWILLNILSVFGPEGLEERRGSAGVYFLRF